MIYDANLPARVTALENAGGGTTIYVSNEALTFNSGQSSTSISSESYYLIGCAPVSDSRAFGFAPGRQINGIWTVFGIFYASGYYPYVLSDGWGLDAYLYYIDK